MAMSRRPSLALLVSLAAVGPGCVHYGSHSMTRWWGDRNTLDRPAFFVERIYHAPPPRERVERYRWQYGVGPGTPAAEPPLGPAVVAAPAPPPSAPPAESEPTSTSKSARAARPNVAWMFGPTRG